MLSLCHLCHNITLLSQMLHNGNEMTRLRDDLSKKQQQQLYMKCIYTIKCYYKYTQRLQNIVIEVLYISRTIYVTYLNNTMPIGLFIRAYYTNCTSRKIFNYFIFLKSLFEL